MTVDLLPAFSQGKDYELAVKIINRLEVAGYKAYFAGGCVRDVLLGKKFNDIDIVTSALPEQIETIFNGQTIPVGKKFGIMIVYEGRVQIEVATFRKDGDYQDGRRPEEVIFSSEKEDVLRRDFTVNALFYDLNRRQLLDYVGGVSDLNDRVLRTVGSPDRRFSEDYLRIHRLYRFALSLDFKIETQTLESAQRHLMGIRKVSAERKHEELLKVFFSGALVEKVYRFYLEKKLFVLFFDQELQVVPFELLKVPMSDEIDLLSVLLWSEESGYKTLLNKLKLSTKVQKSVQKILEFKKRWEEIKLLSEPEKRYFCLQLEFSKFLEKQKSIENHAEMDRLLSFCNQYQSYPPEPLLSGDDLKAYFQGKDLGGALDLVFKEQLVQNWTQKEPALAWILKTKV